MKRKFAELVKDEDGADMLDETGRVKEGKLEALKRAEEHFLGSRYWPRTIYSMLIWSWVRTNC